MTFRNSILILASATGVLMAAESPFVGKWKINPAKSQLAGTTMTYEKLPSGEMQFTGEGQSYKFKIDGKDYPSIWGSTAAWKQIDSSSWETVGKMPGMVITQTTKLSADGKTMTVSARGKKPNGETMEENSTWQRVSGGPGLAGTWKSSKVQVSSENWEFSANGDDGLSIKISDYNAECGVKFDGKGYPCTGPTMPRNFLMSVKKAGPRSLEFTETMDGKVVYHDVFTVSVDGKTMTDEAGAAGTSEKIKIVYDRQ